MKLTNFSAERGWVGVLVRDSARRDIATHALSSAKNASARRPIRFHDKVGWT